jgi:hypothetical protein
VSVRITTYERSTLVNSEKYIGLDVHQATIVVAVMDSTEPGDQSCDHSSVLCGIARNLGGDLRRRNLVRMVVRFAPLPRRQTGGVQSAGRTRCSKTGTRATASMRTSWPIGYAATNSKPSTTGRRACACCANYRGVISPSSKICRG